MKKTSTSTYLKDRKQQKIDAFIHRFFEEEVLMCTQAEWHSGNGVTIELLDITLGDNQGGRDEKALLRYLPYDDGSPYISLVFIPEYNNEAQETQRSVQIHVLPEFFRSFDGRILSEQQPFQSDRSVEQAFTPNAASRDALDFIRSVNLQEQPDFVKQLRLHETAILLLRHSITAFFVPDEANYLPACSFLNNTSERDKILEAQKIILDKIDAPITIRDLSRMVGMNECYLKKGFKALFGKTIHEYRQHQRIEKARILLQQKNMTVNEVAFLLGFGSASHFSTAFKKIAGMKPCELLH
jgi:AraC-like DNA-binding protein